METNFSSDRSRARQLSTNDVDSLLYQAVDEVEMSDVELEFWRLFETFSPELSEVHNSVFATWLLYIWTIQDVDCSSVSLPVGRSRSSPALVFRARAPRARRHAAEHRRLHVTPIDRYNMRSRISLSKS